MVNGRRIFIGDVHGHYDGLMELLEAIALGNDDKLYFLGDLIDRGPKSADVVEFVRSNGHTSLLGNHENLMLDALLDNGVHPPALQAWLYSGGQSTVSSYKSVDLLLEHRDWARTLPTHLDLGDIWLAHAGVHPGLPVSEQTTQEFCWIREQFHSISKPYFEDKTIITGHTITFTLPGVKPGELAQGTGWLDIDTGAYHPKSGWLTGVDMDNRYVYQVNVFNQSKRQMPLEDAVSVIDPSKVLERRRHLMQTG